MRAGVSKCASACSGLAGVCPPACLLVEGVDMLWAGIDRNSLALRQLRPSLHRQNDRLQSVPQSLNEAAAIDGAGPFKRFWTIVFPLLSPTTFFLLIVNINYAMFDTFGLIDATTSGGPNQATNILVYKVYADGFLGLNIGSSAAQSVVLMLIVIALTAIQFRYIERRVQY